MVKTETTKIKAGINTTAILAILIFSAFLGLFNETILNVALNSLMEEMSVTAGTVQWIITSYMIVVAVMVPVTAFLIQTFELKKLYLGAMTILLIGTLGAACSGSFVMLPMFLQGTLQTTAFISAMALLPATLTNGGISLLSGRIYDKIGPKVIIPLGFVIIFFALFVLSRSTVDTSLIKIVLVYIAVCIGIGSTLSPSQTSALNQLPKEAYAHGVAIINTLQQIAAAIGSSLFIGIMSAAQLKELNHSAAPDIAIATGFRSGVSVMLIFILVGLCLSFALRLGNKKLPVSH